MQNCKESILEKIGLLSSLDLKLARFIDSFPKTFHSASELPLTSLFDLQELLNSFKNEPSRADLINEGVCSLCCHSFNIRGIVEDGVSSVVTYNGNEKYHSFCINFWLNKVLANKHKNK